MGKISFKAGICSVACAVAMLAGGKFFMREAESAPLLDLPEVRGDGQLQLKVHGIPNFVYELQGSQNLTNWVPITQQEIVWNTNATSFVCDPRYGWQFFRARGVRTYDTSLLRAGLIVRSNIDIRGSGFVSDSFDSSNPSYSTWVTNATWGTNLVYDVSKRRDHGNVAVMGVTTNSVNLGGGLKSTGEFSPVRRWGFRSH